MLKGWGEILHVTDAHTYDLTSSHIAPISDSTANLCHYLSSLGGIKPESVRNLHNIIYGGDRTGRVRQPHFELPLRVWKRIYIKGRSQSPLASSCVKKRMVSKMVINIGDKKAENDSAPQFGKIMSRIGGNRNDTLAKPGIRVIFIPPCQHDGLR